MTRLSVQISWQISGAWLCRVSWLRAAGAVGGVLSSRRGPRARIQMAPSGAVMRMERTARVRISPPMSFHSSLPYLMQLSRNTGPRAADGQIRSDAFNNKNTDQTIPCTVAFGIQANAIKIFSLLLRVPNETAK